MSSAPLYCYRLEVVGSELVWDGYTGVFRMKEVKLMPKGRGDRERAGF